MKIVQLELSDRLKQVIDYQIAQRRFANEAQFLLEAATRFAETLERNDLFHTAALCEVEQIEGEIRAGTEARVGFR